MKWTQTRCINKILLLWLLLMCVCFLHDLTCICDYILIFALFLHLTMEYPMCNAVLHKFNSSQLLWFSLYMHICVSICVNHIDVDNSMHTRQWRRRVWFNFTMMTDTLWSDWHLKIIIISFFYKKCVNKVGTVGWNVSVCDKNTQVPWIWAKININWFNMWHQIFYNKSFLMLSINFWCLISKTLNLNHHHEILFFSPSFFFIYKI